jgi:uncharacterized membrane protein YfcA
MFDLLIVVLIFILSFLSDMLGLGVALVAIPVLGLFEFELIHVIMPWALLLNGLTSIAAAVKFMQKKMVDYKTAIPLLIITTGPGFLMMPALVILGYSARIAAATNALIVTLPSFSAFVVHIPKAQFDWTIVIVTSVVSIIGAQLGAAFTASKVKSKTLAQIFALVLVVLAVYRIYLLL